ncbi:p-loop containing nucleoside triphosphate hydrolase [Venustampulla echinocandica]|uniref:Elongation factor 1 alpha-like protein n=1 Tax=Venustampulla echinocandica TaxID=2656787 RepID=A0A370TN90_9HELO|nr:p-loop containing nucleoside triphosphate hydrolase [Venustampulla echinocandica]RDL36978.1 p-loop containing nucleoside triphosphate hydrolase [Venustampulla echinocandica]
MSRHKIVKNLDLDDELDDFDGGEDYGYDEEEGEEKMRQGTIKVREALPPTAAHVTDKQVQEALWHYYYDVEKSVKYLVAASVPTTPKVLKKGAAGKKPEGGFISFGVCWSFGQSACNKASTLAGALYPDTCLKPFSFAEFFKDTPWLQVPTDRQTVFIDPIYPRLGLLGGSSDGVPKMSKLQALAAARKKKAQEQRANSNPTGEMSRAGLDKIDHSDLGDAGVGGMAPSGSALLQKPSARGFPLRKRKGLDEHESLPKAPVAIDDAGLNPPASPEDIPSAGQAEPSDFANTMFGSHSQTPRQSPDNLFTMPFAADIASIAANPFAGPSPDDIVIAAQSKAGKGGKGAPKSNGEKKAAQIAAGVEAMRIDDTPRAKSKHLDVLAEFGKAEAKNAANFVVIGHVDAGKSTLMGRLLYDLNVVDKRTIDRYRKEAEKMGKSSFALAWVLDQGSEERARGVTIDIATNTFETDKTSFTILDAPGHRDFIPNMIAGASQADFAVLVIDANTGSFESGLKGQTKEHALLVRSMGVQRIIIVVNKLDTVGWAEDRFTEISTQVSAFLIAAGFLSKNITFIPCSGLHGDNITRRSTEPAASWYQGPTLVEELDNSEPAGRALSKPLRLTIGDIFRGGVQNPLSISSRIESGSLQVGDALLVQPSSQKCFVKALEIDNEPVDWAVAGQNVTLHLSGIEEQYLKIGDVLCTPSNPIQNVKQFTAKVLAFEFLTPSQIDIHRGRLHTPGRIVEIVAVLDKHTGAVVGKKKPRVVKPGLIARIVVELEAPVPLEAPGRVVLRGNGETVAAGLLE